MMSKLNSGWILWHSFFLCIPETAFIKYPKYSFEFAVIVAGLRLCVWYRSVVSKTLISGNCVSIARITVYRTKFIWHSLMNGVVNNVYSCELSRETSPIPRSYAYLFMLAFQKWCVRLLCTVFKHVLNFLLWMCHK